MKKIFEVVRPVCLTLCVVGFVISGYFIFEEEIAKIIDQRNLAQRPSLEDLAKVDEEDTELEQLLEETEKVEETEVTEVIDEGPVLPVAENVDQVEGDIPEGFYKDTLFVGDSRTLGIEEYGQIPDASFFADSGMSVYKLGEKTKEMEGLGQVTLESLLSQKKYKRIYFMIGINELGYDRDTSIAKFAEWVDIIQQLQPDADLVIGANMHVTKSRSDNDAIFNNYNIDALNLMMKEIADKRGLVYVDVNTIFDDETHSLAEAYSNDDTHPLGRYYKAWGIWLANYIKYNNFG